MAHMKSLGVLAGLAAASALAATPASAAELPSSPASTSLTSGAFSSAPAFDLFTPEAETVEHHRYRRYRGYRRGYRRHRRVGVGDLIAGAVIIGGIAAIANSASRNNERRNRDRDYDRRDRDYDNRDRRRGDSRYEGGSGIDNAVSRCVSQIERDVRVEGVDSVDRTGEGWRVTGSLYNGDRFTCQIGNDGRVSNVDFGGGFSGASATDADDRQLSDDRYIEARRTRGMSEPDSRYQATVVRPTPESSAQPAYPGGPLPGETFDERVDGDIGG